NTGPGRQSVQVAQARAVPHPDLASAVGQRPHLPVPAERVIRLKRLRWLLLRGDPSPRTPLGERRPPRAPPKGWYGRGLGLDAGGPRRRAQRAGLRPPRRPAPGRG